MTVLALQTADLQDLTRWTSHGANVAISNTWARTGTYSFRLPDSYPVSQTIPQSSAIFTRSAHLITGVSTISSFIYYRQGSTPVVTVVFNTVGGTIVVKRGDSSGTTLGSIACISADVPFCLEVHCAIHATTGRVTLKLNGNTVLDLENQNTLGGGTGVIDNVYWTHYSGGYTYLDDICIRDDTWPGQHGIYVKAVNGAGDNAGWTASAGTPTDCVSDIPADFTDYISADASVADTKHDFATAALPITPSSVGAAGVVIKGKLDSAGSGKIRAYAKSGASYGTGTDVGLDVAAAWVDHYLTADPAGGTWNAATIDALKIGVETRT